MLINILYHCNFYSTYHTHTNMRMEEISYDLVSLMAVDLIPQEKWGIWHCMFRKTALKKSL